MGLTVIQILATLAALVVVAIRRKVPNWLSLGGMLVGVALWGLNGGVVNGLLGALAAMAGLTVLAFVGVAGPGDLKLAGAIGALAGLDALGLIFLWILGLTLILLLLRLTEAGAFRRIAAWLMTVLGLVRWQGEWRRHLLAQVRGRTPLALVLLSGSAMHYITKLLNVISTDRFR